jgi:TonB-dependent receptor
LAFAGLALMALMACAGALAQSPEGTGGIEGAVHNSINSLPVGRAKVVLKGTDREALTDDEGRYRFLGVPAGGAEIEVSYLGFVSQSAALTVTPGQIATRDFSIVREGTVTAKKPGSDEVVLLEAFSVVADQQMTAQALAMNEQRHAPNIKNVMAFEELGDHGQENIGDYLRFLPGVAILDDDDSAGTLALGGFGAEFTNMQLDGGDFAATGSGEESSRTLSLRDVPTVNIERIEVTKVPTPDMAASGLGGSVNLVTKSLLGTKSPYFKYQMYMTFNNKDGFSIDGGSRQLTSQVSPKFKQPSFNADITYPLTRRLVLSLGFSRSWRQRAAEGTPTENATWNLKTTDKYINAKSGPADGEGNPTAQTKDIAMTVAQWTQVAEITTTENFQGGVEWKMAKNDTLAFTLQHRETSGERAAARITTRFYEAGRFDPRGDATYTEKKPETAYNNGSTQGVMEMHGNGPLNYENAADSTHLTARYKHRGPLWRVDGQAIYSSATRTRTSLGKGYFAGVNARVADLNMRGDGINSGDSILPTTYSITNSYGEVFNVYDGANYDVQGVATEDGTYGTDLYAGRVDVERILGSNFALKVGGAYNKMEKDDRRFQKTHTFAPEGGSGSLRASDYDFIAESGVTMNGNPVRWIDPVKVYKLYEEHPDWFPEAASSTPERIALGSVRLEEIVSAAYLRFDLNLLRKRLHLIGGVRYEKTELNGWSMLKDESAIYQKDANGIPMKDDNGRFVKLPGIDDDPVRANNLIYKERASHAGQSYDGLYPSLNANFTITDNLILRAAYARTIGRPDVRYVAGGMSIPPPGTVEEDEEITNIKIISVGNPGLEPWTADSFHLSLDSYHFKGGFGSIGVYRKNVTNFFAQLTVPLTREALAIYGLSDEVIDFYLAGNDYALRRYENVGDASLNGIELSYRQDLFFLPAWLRTVQVWVNYTHLAVSGPNAEDFTGFTPDAVSWGVNWIRPRFAIRLSCAYQAETKKRIVPEEENYIPAGTYDYQSSYLTCDLNAEYSFSKSLSVYVNWIDMFSKDRFIYRRSADTPAYARKYQRDVRPSYITIGVKGRF